MLNVSSNDKTTASGFALTGWGSTREGWNMHANYHITLAGISALAYILLTTERLLTRLRL